MNPRILLRRATGSTTTRAFRPAARRPGLYLSLAAAGAVAVNLLTGVGTDAADGTPLESVSVAEQLGLPAEPSVATGDAQSVRPLEQLLASRSERDADRIAAVQVQAAADQAELDRRAAEEAARAAAEQAARAAAEEAARVEAARAAEEAARVEAERAAEAPAAQPRRGTAAAVAPAGSYQEYAMGKLGGNGSEFGCLERLWGKESGWNPNAQNPTSTAYGIAQFLDSTWAGTGIAKTSDGYRQIDAGLVYIQNRFGSPCGAWSHSQARGWY